MCDQNLRADLCTLCRELTVLHALEHRKRYRPSHKSLRARVVYDHPCQWRAKVENRKVAVLVGVPGAYTIQILCIENEGRLPRGFDLNPQYTPRHPSRHVGMARSRDLIDARPHQCQSLRQQRLRSVAHLAWTNLEAAQDPSGFECCIIAAQLWALGQDGNPLRGQQ